ncbi:NAD(P)H-dependent glycerol-3-phosphate dehydrogenase [Methyloligella sp. 2.7D]|uniref:NAD(P)H-dependent glycerol-3-phosphate dehydrogenase n=1 Tax=unclassified Methyloligella TaxID=2625955 RepID=UPI00157DD22B|nr:NAD(P)H-dependent glycerol-3-phosphate dehydrogenase [Methyloligella sp. GL2]QKP76184.1 NAD(P)-dependent glycerol-3-phosphate dehydrogenase [Methyloligella sp. GL2]
MTLQRVGIVGAGAWGTALAISAHRAGLEPRIWGFEAAVVEEINSGHENASYLPGIPLDPAIRATASLKEIAEQDIVLLAPPAQFLRPIATELAFHLRPRQQLIICSKGIEQATGTLLSGVLAEVAPKAEVGVLSGPGFADEVAKGLPAAVTLAVGPEADGEALAEALSHPSFRCYLSDDVIGAQVGGAVKNVLAIAAGIVVGKALGASASAALVSRGFAEMTRFGIALGAKRETMAGLSGLGDLILTCGSVHSRNMSLGVALGEGRRLEDVLESRNSVTEGIYTAGAVVEIAAAKGIDMPICHAVHGVISGLHTVDEAIEALLSRPLRTEAER